MHSINTTQPRGVKIVAFFEGMKGLMIVLVGLELLKLIHTNIHAEAQQIVMQFHLNPASHYPRIFLDVSEHLSDTKLWALSMISFCYATMRIVEAGGLWFEKSWAEWFAALSSAIYIPIELYELFHGITWAKTVLFAVNLGIVCYLTRILCKKHRNVR